VILNSNQLSARGDRDFRIGSRTDHLSVSAFYSNGTFTSPGGGSGNSASQAYYYPLNNKNLAINDTLVLSSNLINELVLGGNYKPARH